MRCFFLASIQSRWLCCTIRSKRRRFSVIVMLNFLSEKGQRTRKTSDTCLTFRCRFASNRTLCQAARFGPWIIYRSTWPIAYWIIWLIMTSSAVLQVFVSDWMISSKYMGDTRWSRWGRVWSSVNCTNRCCLAILSSSPSSEHDWKLWITWFGQRTQTWSNTVRRSLFWKTVQYFILK